MPAKIHGNSTFLTDGKGISICREMDTLTAKYFFSNIFPECTLFVVKIVPNKMHFNVGHRI